MKKIIFFIFILLFTTFNFVSAQEIEIDFFYSFTCPHCTEEKKFLDDFQERYPEVKINRYSVSDKEAVELLKNLYNEYQVPANHQGMVPITFTNNKYFLGFNEKIGKNIEECILECEPDGVSDGGVTIIDLDENIELPFVGKISIKKYSLPVLAIILGTLDGFNVCSLGALILILGLVLAIGSRKKTLLFGGIFIFTTAFVYGLLIFIWYQIFSYLIFYMRIMEIIIGLVGIGGAIYLLKRFFKFRKYGPTCEIAAGKGVMARFSSKFQDSLKNSKSIILLLATILFFAAIITIIEFPCSAVVPVAFAGILAQAELSTVSYLFHIILFVIFYMLDEIIVFLVAFFAMKIWLASSKALTWITLLEAIILFSLGIYYLF